MTEAAAPRWGPAFKDGFLLGCGLGLRFKVLILVPAVTSAMLGAAVAGIARGGEYWSVVVAMILFGTAVQFGSLLFVEAQLSPRPEDEQQRQLIREIYN
jgi:hypothetical protein